MLTYCYALLFPLGAIKINQASIVQANHNAALLADMKGLAI